VSIIGEDKQVSLHRNLAYCNRIEKHRIPFSILVEEQSANLLLRSGWRAWPANLAALRFNPSYDIPEKLPSNKRAYWEKRSGRQQKAVLSLRRGISQRGVLTWRCCHTVSD